MVSFPATIDHLPIKQNMVRMFSILSNTWENNKCEGKFYHNIEIMHKTKTLSSASQSSLHSCA